MKDTQKVANEHFVRFVARNYYGVSDRSRVRFLDIGSGNGANTWHLACEGFTVTALDKSAEALGAMKDRLTSEQERKPWAWHRITPICENIADAQFAPGTFDCIVDVNTLCHVPDPPMYMIADALKRGGKFFCIAPADDTWRERVGKDKPYTRFCDRFDMRALLLPFTSSTINRASYSEGSHEMVSWFCEAHS